MRERDPKSVIRRFSECSSVLAVDHGMINGGRNLEDWGISIALRVAAACIIDSSEACVPHSC